ncbi:aliphatic sulfonate ABC transporter substrate-binding protein [Paenibacillus sp. N10]|uniref:Putative aliphatic sulfonates-binding protein n=2 Tax=Paenibacillus lutrae TaxID=2078573 RepID=A0A7X3FH10_9BACL|nr:aliphatic sulfonate ABC transporter substrate-binding protein [Paenibacillus lutrae]
MMLKGRKTRYMSFLLAAALIVPGLMGCSAKLASSGGESDASLGEKKEKTVVNIGIQHSLGPLLIAREKKWFEEAYAQVGAEVKWHEFQSGPPHFEAITAGRLDFGMVGNGPVIAAQASNLDFKEIAVTGDGKKGNAILLPKGSPIQSVQDLKGKKVAVAKGSSSWIFLYRALQEANVQPKDIKIVQLQPDEAKPAFGSGAVDAWAIWEPFITNEVESSGARILTDGEELNLLGPGFAVARTAFTKEHPDLTVLFLKTYEESRLWMQEHRDEAAEILAKAKKLEPETVRKILENTEPMNAVISDEFIEAQQTTADFMYENEAIKQQIDVTKVVDNTFIKQALAQVGGTAAVPAAP